MLGLTNTTEAVAELIEPLAGDLLRHAAENLNVIPPAVEVGAFQLSVAISLKRIADVLEAAAQPNASYCFPIHVKEFGR